MASKVFISCGQSNDKEKKVAKDVSNWLISKGFETYVAIQTHSILEINNDIIKELKKSDYYLFINFKREKIIKTLKDIFKKPVYRGSLFTNQELSIAYSMGFDKMLFVNQKSVKKDGIFGYIGSNTPDFDNYDEVLNIVQKAITESNWNPSYSRNLIYQNLVWSSQNILYSDHTGQKNVKVLYIDIKNNRPDIGALNTVARLKTITNNGNTIISPDRSYLKCTGTIGYSNIILPDNHIAFDLLSVDVNNPTNVYLHSSLDVTPRAPIISQAGIYNLEYEIYAESFPVLNFSIQLSLNGDINNINATLL